MPLKNKWIKLVVFTSVFQLFFLSGATSAYTHISCYGEKLKWRSKDIPVQFYASKHSFPAGSSYSNAFEVALDRWYDNPSNGFFKKSLNYGETFVNTKNLTNEIWFSSNVNTPTSVIRNKCKANKQYIAAADVIFPSNAGYILHSGNKKKQINAYDKNLDNVSFQGTTTHELGHVFGLDHESRWYNIMGNSQRFFQTNSKFANAYVGEDASHGAVALYGVLNESQWHDISVTHFKYSSAFDPENGQTPYALHKFTSIYLPSHDSPMSNNLNYEQTYNLAAGKSYKVEFTYENSGIKKLTDIDVAFYLSKDDNITTSDQLIKTGKIDLARDKPATLKTGVFIHPAQSEGKYWLGVIIDYKNKISELREDNNATYLPVFIKNFSDKDFKAAL